MRKRNCKILVALVTLALSRFAAADEITQEGAVNLMEECQAQREQKIAPLREQAIEDCVSKKRRDRQYCESYNRTFGNAMARGNGTMIPGMFWNLPVCEKALAAQRYFRINPGRRVYSIP
jgi:hypothetical protein